VITSPTRSGGFRQAPGPGTQGPPARPEFHAARLANGLTVIVLPNPVVPLVTIEINVKNGSFTETYEYNGLSHLYEHMFFKANASIPDQEAYMRRTRELGMEWNGTTSEERVNYYFTLHQRDVRAGLEFMDAAIRTPLFRPDELERERQVVLGEYDRAESDPDFHLMVAVHKKLWYAHWTRKNVIGEREIIATATPEKMRTIQSRYYVPNNSALLLAGDVDPQAAVAQVEAVLGGWPAGPDPFAAHPVPDHPTLEESSTVVVEKPVETVTLLQAFHGPRVDQDRAATFAADVFGSIVGQRNSRFYRRLVDSGLCASASLSYQTLRCTGPVQALLRTDAAHFHTARETLRDEIAHFAEPGAFTDEELENARNELEVSALYESERPSQHVHTLGYWWAVADLEYYRTYVEQVRRVTREDVQAFARRYLVGRPSVTGILLAPEVRATLLEGV
jgi:zinc protease